MFSIFLYDLCSGIYVLDGFEHSWQFLWLLSLLMLSLCVPFVLLCDRAIMTHASVPEEERIVLGISDTLIRLSVGLEDEQDIINDLDQALAAAVCVYSTQAQSLSHARTHACTVSLSLSLS